MTHAILLDAGTPARRRRRRTHLELGGDKEVGKSGRAHKVLELAGEVNVAAIAENEVNVLGRLAGSGTW